MVFGVGMWFYLVVRVLKKCCCCVVWNSVLRGGEDIVVWGCRGVLVVLEDFLWGVLICWFCFWYWVFMS